MKLYKISQTENIGYDTYDSAIVAAPDEDTARMIDPDGRVFPNWKREFSYWCPHPSQVTVEYIGEAKEDAQQGVVIGSFNAG